MKKTGRDDIREQYRAACRLANDAILSSKQTFYARKIKEAKSSPRQCWSVIRDLLHQNTENRFISSEDCHSLSNTFANFFRDKVVTVKDNITSTPRHQTLSSRTSFTVANCFVH